MTPKKASLIDVDIDKLPPVWFILQQHESDHFFTACVRKNCSVAQSVQINSKKKIKKKSYNTSVLQPFHDLTNDHPRNWCLDLICNLFDTFVNTHAPVKNIQ